MTKPEAYFDTTSNQKHSKYFFWTQSDSRFVQKIFFEPRATRDSSKIFFLNPERLAIPSKIFFWTRTVRETPKKFFLSKNRLAIHSKYFFWAKTDSESLQNKFGGANVICNHSKTIGLRVMKFGEKLNSLVVYNRQKAIITAVPQHLRSIIFVVPNRNIVRRSTRPGF